MKHIKEFNEFINEITLNETVYSSGLGGNLIYANHINSDAKQKALQILNTHNWQKTNEGKFAISEAEKLANMWNAKDQSTQPKWFNEYKRNVNGDLTYSNFINVTTLTVVVLNKLSKQVQVEWIDTYGTRNRCFDNSANWANENSGIAIGGICMSKDAINKYYVESLVVHAFTKKDNTYYEVTFPNAKITHNNIYWPLINFNKTSGDVISKDIWSYALGIEEGVKEYITHL